MIERVLRIAYDAHSGQYRMGEPREPYIFHPVRVYEAVKRVSPEDVELQAAALLHDVVEDTDWTLDALRGAGLPPRVVAIVDLVTRREGEKYFDYIRNVANSPSATLLKLADIADNQRDLPEELRGLEKLEKRYEKARQILLGFSKQGVANQGDLG